MNRDKNLRRSRQVVRVKVGVLTSWAIERVKAGRKMTDGAMQGGDGRLIVRARAAHGGTVREFAFRWHDADGQERLLTLGTFPNLSIDDARAEARRLRTVRANGGDPRVDVERRALAREHADREKRESGTLRDLLDAYVAALKTASKPSAPEVERALQRHVLTAFPALVRRKASDITPQDIVEILRRMIAARLTRKTNMVRSYLLAAFNRAMRSDLDPRRAAQHRSVFRLTINPVRDVPRQADFDRVGDRVLTDFELRVYVDALSARRDPIAAALHIALLLGGQRLVQLLRITWEDYDTDARTLRLRDPKGRGGARDHILPVSPRVATLLPLPHPDGGPFIFTTGRSVAIHPSTLSTDVTTIAATIVKSGPLFTARDLRRSVETRLAALGVSKDLRAQVLSHGLHRDVQSKHYDRHLYLVEKASALAIWEKHLSDLPKEPPAPSAKDRARLRLVA